MVQTFIETKTDQHLVLPGTWESFKHIQRGFEAAHGAKLSYYNGMIEILMPGELHAFFASVISYLMMTFFTEKRIPFKPTRDKDQEKAGEASAQADESYCLGDFKPIPDLSIEVVYTSGGINKLARYFALGVPEVWFWEDGALMLYHRRENGYERIQKSELAGLESLNIDHLQRCILLAETDWNGAVEAFRKGIES